MQISAERLAARYAVMSDEELLILAGQYDLLTPEAQPILEEELQKRGQSLPNRIGATDVPQSRRLTTVRRFRDLSEAIVSRALLESAGITAFLRDENYVRLDWQLSNFIGGIRLEVSEEEAAEAIDILNQPVPDNFSYGIEEAFEQPRCPSCGSIEIEFRGASRTAALALLYVASLPAPPGPTSWRCNACGSLWREEKAPSEE
ncbi:DUF2007 domain-containing protein [Silvibacterium dinghuense]|uniref:DUF2007 domain-containing protein n=1 Tax=Silvibacterium dinghuense TaxID=1560006 RepID=A0A4Q1SIH2_9BACT|nr:DUF2007 domain-containing protein [Silvibacterium dinghuense]RXS97197.1 DUF2007 domain-containing protein [Silvibacterium dinghuense]